jgi:hypothetical protein
MKFYPKKSRRPLKAIRYFCLECHGWDRRRKDSGRPIEEVRNCLDELCPLYDFRFGRNPHLKGGKGNPKALEDYRKSQEKSHEDRISQ